MAIYNLSEFLTLIKQDIGITDIPLPVDDKALAERLQLSALREFSMRYPRIEEIILNDSNCISKENRQITGSATYVIPKDYYAGSQVLSVLGIDASPRSGDGAALYYPSFVMGSADVMLTTIADIKLAAQMGTMMSHSPTYRFISPDKIIVYNGWYAATYIFEIGLMHDINLTTIPDTAMTHFRQLATLDIKTYLYKQLKRKDNLDVGIGNISLKIDDWEGAENEMKELLKDWDENGANLDLDTINYWN